MALIIQIFYGILEMFGIFAVGAFARHFKYVNENELNRLSALILDIFFPLFVFSSVIRKFDPDRASELWILPLAGFGLMALGALLGIFLKHGLKNKSEGRLKTFHHFCAVNNYGFLPIIIIGNIWGESAYPLLFILNIGSNLGFWIIGVSLLGEGDLKSSLKNVLTPTTVALVLAILISMCRIKFIVPEVLLNIFGSVGSCAVPFILLVIGAGLYNTSQMFRNKQDLAYLIFVRLLLIPAISILILRFLPLPKDAYNIACVVAVMPTATSSTILTRRYGGSPEFAGQAALLTTVASIVTIPLFLYFALEI